MLSKIDELTRPDHFYLDPSDDCYFLREYTARRPYQFSETNQLILNLKKSVDRRGRPEWAHKERAIRQDALELHESLNPDWTRAALLVPVPPSKARTDQLYDDRLVQVLQQMPGGINAREIVIQTASTTPDHDTPDRRTPSEIEAVYQVNDRFLATAARTIGIFDDVLTTGAHFKAMKSVLQRQFPAASIIGLFVARRVFASPFDESGPESPPAS